MILNYMMFYNINKLLIFLFSIICFYYLLFRFIFNSFNLSFIYFNEIYFYKTTHNLSFHIISTIFLNLYEIDKVTYNIKWKK